MTYCSMIEHEDSDSICTIDNRLISSNQRQDSGRVTKNELSYGSVRKFD